MSKSRSYEEQIKRLVEDDSKYKIDQRIESIVRDIQLMAKRAEHKRLKGTVTRKIRKAVMRDGIFPNVEETPVPKYGDMEVEIDTHFGDGEVARRNRVRVEPRNYGLEVSADGPITVYQMSSNRLTVVCCDTQEIYDFIAEEN